MNVLVDSSVWIDYFREGVQSEKLDAYIDQNLVCVNDLILAELIPFLKVKNQNMLIALLNEVTNIPLDIDWRKIIVFQTVCLRKGINKIGIPDLIILENVIDNNLTLFTLDRHFSLMNQYISFKVI